MIIIYIDIILLVILLVLSCFTCGYCLYRVHRLRRNGQIEILLKPTKVLFATKKEIDGTEELRTVVAYQNPFTGDYCIHKKRTEPKGYINEMNISDPESPDSGMSDEYEPLTLDPHSLGKVDEPTKPMSMTEQKNRLSKTWNWNYKEYQI